MVYSNVKLLGIFLSCVMIDVLGIMDKGKVHSVIYLYNNNTRVLL